MMGEMKSNSGERCGFEKSGGAKWTMILARRAATLALSQRRKDQSLLDRHVRLEIANLISHKADTFNRVESVLTRRTRAAAASN